MFRWRPQYDILGRRSDFYHIPFRDYWKYGEQYYKKHWKQTKENPPISSKVMKSAIAYHTTKIFKSYEICHCVPPSKSKKNYFVRKEQTPFKRFLWRPRRRVMACAGIPAKKILYIVASTANLESFSKWTNQGELDIGLIHLLDWKQSL